MPTFRFAVIIRAAGAILALSLGAIAPAHAQSDFRVTHTAERRGADQVEVTGKVFNETRLHANNVALTIYALDKSGGVLARTTAYIGTVAQQDNAPFATRLKVGPDMANVRVTVTSYRLGVFPQGP